MPGTSLRRASCIALLAVLAACGGKSATGPQTRNLTGSWAGTSSNGFTFTFTIVDSAQGLHGTGHALIGTAVDTPITIVGSHIHPYFHISFTFAGNFQPVSFDGNDSTETSLVGVLTGSGFTGQSLVEIKQ